MQMRRRKADGLHGGQRRRFCSGRVPTILRTKKSWNLLNNITGVAVIYLQDVKDLD